MSSNQTASSARAQVLAYRAAAQARASKQFQDDVTGVKTDYPKIGRCSGDVLYYEQTPALFAGITKSEVDSAIASLKADGFDTKIETASQWGTTPKASTLTISWCTPADLVRKQ